MVASEQGEVRRQADQTPPDKNGQHASPLHWLGFTGVTTLRDSEKLYTKMVHPGTGGIQALRSQHEANAMDLAMGPDASCVSDGA